MLLSLLIITIFVTWFPVRLTRNTILYITGFVLYFSVRAPELLLTNLTPRMVGRIDSIMPIFGWIA